MILVSLRNIIFVVADFGCLAFLLFALKILSVSSAGMFMILRLVMAAAKYMLNCFMRNFNDIFA